MKKLWWLYRNWKTKRLLRQINVLQRRRVMITMYSQSSRDLDTEIKTDLLRVKKETEEELRRLKRKVIVQNSSQ